MELNAVRGAVVLAFLLAGLVTTNGQRDYRDQSIDLLRFLASHPRVGIVHSWDRPRRAEAVNDDELILQDDEQSDLGNYVNEELRSEKRSAVASALNAGRRRREPTPQGLGKAVSPFVGVGGAGQRGDFIPYDQVQSPGGLPVKNIGVINDMDLYLNTLLDNLDDLSSLSPNQRAALFANPPTVVHAPSSGVVGSTGGAGGLIGDVSVTNGGMGGTTGGAGGGIGMRRLHALRPLRHAGAGNIRTYNRRSGSETYAGFPTSNHHDPGLLWAGLGR